MCPLGQYLQDSGRISLWQGGEGDHSWKDYCHWCPLYAPGVDFCNGNYLAELAELHLQWSDHTFRSSAADLEWIFCRQPENQQASFYFLQRRAFIAKLHSELCMSLPDNSSVREVSYISNNERL